MENPNGFVPDTRSLAQFFYEVGFASCFAEATIRNDMKPPFELSDALIEAAWPRSIEAYDDGVEMDQRLALADAAPDLLDALEEVQEMNRKGLTGSEARIVWAKVRAAIAKARGAA